jgi:hypothetical protein
MPFKHLLLSIHGRLQYDQSVGSIEHRIHRYPLLFSSSTLHYNITIVYHNAHIDRLGDTTEQEERSIASASPLLHVVGIIVAIHLILADTQQDLGFSPTTPDPLDVWE